MRVHFLLARSLRWPGRLGLRRRAVPAGRPLAVVLLVVACHMASGCAPRPVAAPGVKRVILILLDAGRFDHFSRVASMPGGFYQHPTPGFSRVVFTRNYSQANGTVTSVSQLMTGRYYSAKYVGYEHIGDWSQLRSRDLHEVTMPELFSRAGFRTAFFSAHPYISKGGSRLGSYFDEGYLELKSDVRKFPAIKADFDTINRVFLPWLGRHRTEKFFAYVHTVDTHFPHEPSLEQVGRFLPGAQSSPYQSVLAKVASNGRIEGTDERQMVEALYDADIAEVQTNIGRVFGALAEFGMTEDAVVVVCADHGDELGENGRTGHYTLNEWTLHTPLIVWTGHAVGSQRIVNDLTQNVDIFPTLADLAGIDIRNYRVDGRLLAPYIRERMAGTAGGDATAFAINQASTGEADERREVVIGQRFCLIRYGDNRIEMTDASADPGFDHDWVGDDKVRAGLVRQLAARLAARQDIDLVPLEEPSPIWLRYLFRLRDIQNMAVVTTDPRESGKASSRGKWFVDDGLDANPHISTIDYRVEGLRLRIPPVPVGRYQVYTEVYSSASGSFTRSEILLAKDKVPRVVRSSRKDESVETIPLGTIDSDGKGWPCVIQKNARDYGAVIYALVFVPVGLKAEQGSMGEINERLKGLGYVGR